MAWTTPRTWVVGEVVTAAIMNAHVRDNLTYLHSLYVQGGQIGLTIPAGFGTNITWGTFGFPVAFASVLSVVVCGYDAVGPGAAQVWASTWTTTTFTAVGTGGGNNPASGVLDWIAVGTL